MNYDDEARNLFASLGLDPSGAGKSNIYNPMDAIYCDQTTGGKVFVGNDAAAKNLPELQSRGVTHVVNCTDNLPLYHEGTLTYLRFNIAYFPAQPDVQVFLASMFDFVDAALAQGGSVLVHCLAGAHRAGTTGCLLLMRFMNMTQCVLVTKPTIRVRLNSAPVHQFLSFC